MRTVITIFATMLCALAVEARTYTTVFINHGLAAPLTVKTHHGTYKVNSSLTLHGDIEPTHVTDGNGNWVVIGGRSYNEDGDEATITYNFSTLYNSSSSTSSSKSSNKRSRLSKEERRERAAERRAAAIHTIGMRPTTLSIKMCCNSHDYSTPGFYIDDYSSSTFALFAQVSPHDL